MLSSDTSSVQYVPESAFGVWFLRTHTWEHHVLRVAINDLKRLIDTPLPEHPVIIDAGCGQGISFHLLADAFKPRRLVGIDFHARRWLVELGIIGEIKLPPVGGNAPHQHPPTVSRIG